MEQCKEAYRIYRDSFPSDEFCLKHFGADVTVRGNPHRGEVSAGLYSELRYLFDGVLRCMPGHILQRANSAGKECEPVFVFKDGLPADWVDPVLERRGLMLELSSSAWPELAKEFIGHCVAGAFHQREWWQWCTTDTSIWIEVIPEVVASGKNKLKSLDELFDEFPGPSHRA